MISSADMEQLREELIEQRGSLVARLHDLEESLGEAADRDWGEAAAAAESSEVLGALDDQERAELGKIQRALDRMDRAEYGACATCGREIPLERLRALPAAERCTRCQEAEEAGGN